MTHICQNLLSESDLERIDQAAVRILEKQGGWFQSRRVLEALDEVGCAVDYEQEVARIPESYIREVIAASQARGRSHPNPATSAEPYQIGFSGELAQFIFDYEQFEQHPSTQQDFIAQIKWAYALNDGELRVGPLVLMQDVPGPIEPLVAFKLLYEHTGPPASAYPYDVQQLDYLRRMWEIVYGNTDEFGDVSNICISTITPRRMDQRTGDYLARRAELGYRCSVLTEAICGGTSPVTIAGTVVAGVADILAGWAAVYALNPEMELRGATLTGAMDMRTGNMSICCPESLLQDAAICEVFRRLYGEGRLHVALSAEYTDARVPGLPAAYEKVMKAILISEYVGTAPYLGIGLVENGKTYSREQTLLNLEMGEFLQRYYHGFEVNEETMAVDEIMEVGFGRGQSFMETDHTLRHFREVWYPRYLDRSLWEDGPRELAKDREVMQKVSAEVKEIEDRYVPPEIDSDKLAALQVVVDEAAQQAGLQGAT